MEKISQSKALGFQVRKFEMFFTISVDYFKMFYQKMLILKYSEFLKHFQKQPLS